MEPVAALILRLALACLLGSAALHKLRDFSGFRVSLSEYQIMPQAFTPVAAALVVGAEILIALGLLLPVWLPVWAATAGIAAACLLLLYGAAIGINLLRGRTHIDCGCFGPAGKGVPISRALVVRNLVLAAAAIATILPVVARPLVWLDAFTIGGGVLLLAVMYMSANLLISPETLRSGATAPGG